MRRTANTLLLIGIFVIMIFTAYGFVSAAGEWPSLGQNQQRTSWVNTFVPDYSASTGYDSTGLVEEVNMSELLGAQSSPLIKDDILYLMTGTGIYAYDLSMFDPADPDASLIWSDTQVGGGFSTPTIASVPLNATTNFDAICYTASSKLACRVASEVPSFPDAQGQLLFGGDGYFQETSLHFGAGQSPLIHDGIVWTGSGSSSDQKEAALLGLDIYTGDIFYRFEPERLDAFQQNDWVSTPSIDSDGNTLYFTVRGASADGGRVYALDATDGETVKWQREFDRDSEGYFRYQVPTPISEKLIVPVTRFEDQVPYVLALNKNDGTEIWRYDITDTDPDQGFSPHFNPWRAMPSPYGGRIIFSGSSSDGFLPGETPNAIVYALDENTGELIWKSDMIPGFSLTSPSIADSKVVIGTNEELCVLDSSDGTLIWNDTSYGEDPQQGYYGFAAMSDDIIYTVEKSGILRMHKSDNKHVEPLVPPGLVLGTGACSWDPPPPPNGDFCIEARARADTEINVKFIDGDPPENATSETNVTVTKFLSETDLDLDEGSGTIQTEDGLVQLNKFIDVDVEGLTSEEINADLEWADVRIYYTDDDLWAAGIQNESLLRIFSYNITNQSWEPLDMGGVNTDENYVFGRTYHFSEFGGGSIQQDSDGDDVFDIDDNCVATPNTEQLDDDGDGIGNACDNCEFVSNGNQLDQDGDLLGDACDPDIDGDMANNTMDLCPYIPDEDPTNDDGDNFANQCDNCINVQNNDQANHDLDPLGDACDDNDDGDPFLDVDDNCPLIYSSIELPDLDGDGLGDACDSDIDGDGEPNEEDFCPLINITGIPDFDGDMVGDLCDNCLLVENPGQYDSDGDGMGNACDACQYEVTPWDLDNSADVGTPDFLELLANWGPCEDPDNCPADFDESGNVGTPDFLELLANWGPLCSQEDGEPITAEEWRTINDAFEEALNNEEYREVKEVLQDNGYDFGDDESGARIPKLISSDQEMMSTPGKPSKGIESAFKYILNLRYPDIF